MNELHEYWISPCERNAPEKYLQGEERSEFLYNFISDYCIKDDAILEIGCNVGRNLNYLYDKGFHNLTGIEINKNAIGIMKRKYKQMFNDSKIINGPAGDSVKKLKGIECIFTMAVFCHIGDEEFECIKDAIENIKPAYIITIEDEKKISERHIKRNYSEHFENEIFVCNCGGIIGLGKNYICRVFYSG